MTTIESKAKIIIEAENRAKPALQQASSQIDKINKKVRDLEPAFRSMRNVGLVAFGALAIGVGKAINKARDFEEETNKFNVVFKDVSKEAEKMTETLNKSYGLSRLESKKLLSATGDILTGFGFTGKSALDLSSKVNTLAVDLASFTNAQGGAEAVSSALTKALLGERESLKTYGIAIQDADVQAELLARGMDKLTGEALRQAKAQVTLDLAFRQSKNAVGDYARSTGSLTQTQKELAKNIEDLQITLGEKFAPILNDILQDVVPVIEKMTKWIEENPKLTKTIVIVTGVLAGLLVVIGSIGLLIPGVITVVQGLGTAFTVASTKGLLAGATLNSMSFAGVISSIGLIAGAVALVSVQIYRTIQAFNELKRENELLKNSFERLETLENKTRDRIQELRAEGKTEQADRLSGAFGKITSNPLELNPSELSGLPSLNPVNDEIQASTPSINFDFSNAVITDKDSFIRNIKTKLGRDLVLFEQGI